MATLAEDYVCVDTLEHTLGQVLHRGLFHFFLEHVECRRHKLLRVLLLSHVGALTPYFESKAEVLWVVAFAV